MGIVTLVSGGIDSALMAVLAKEEGIKQFPLFINYGQICAEQENRACLDLHEKLGLPLPTVLDVRGFGQLIMSGLTSRAMRIYEDAFLPGRNLLFLLVGSAYAYQTSSTAVAIGLLSEESHLFPDQTAEFLKMAEEVLCLSVNKNIKVLAPLMQFNKIDVMELAKQKGIHGTYSCHAGTATPCGLCISCREARMAMEGGI